ncbi:MAG: hypothetical protein LBL65_03085 [Campylobacteraceae bacterium]|nr:hypothetical protein [Campylobacteraceae bacterium]
MIYLKAVRETIRMFTAEETARILYMIIMGMVPGTNILAVMIHWSLKRESPKMI